MGDQEHHDMVLEATHESGAEEWFCPTCGRRFIMRWPPTYEKTVLVPGDEFAIHSGSKGDMLHMRSFDIVDSADAKDDNPLPVHPSRSLPAEDELPAIVRPDGDDQAGDIPITDELKPWLKWFARDDANDHPGEQSQAV
jgi:hypothetical protein